VAALRLFEQLRTPIITVVSAMTTLNTTKPTAARAIDVLVDCGVLSETSGKNGTARLRTVRI
jgi:Fic family protein